MNVQPIIHRELLGASRRRETWRLRMGFGIAAILAFAFGMLWPHIRTQERGMAVLVCLTIAGFVLSLFTGAYLTANAITTEKREGTLGLLFLTPLNGWEIIVGKMAMHSLQVGYALLGAFPVFFLPVLLGSVVWAEVLRILLVLLLTLSLSLACGIFFSTHIRETRNAVLATAITMALLTLLPWTPVLLGELFGGSWRMYGLPQLSPMTTLVYAFDAKFQSRVYGHFIFWGSAAWLAFGSVALTSIAGWRLPRIWRNAESGNGAGPSAPAAKTAAKKRVPHWALPMDQAPLLWLAARDLAESPWIKYFRWLALGFFVLTLAACTVIQRNRHEFFIAAACAAYVLHLATRIQLLLAATHQFHADRQSGALEAILATPVSDSEVNNAHHESLRHGFRKHLFILIAVNLLLEAVVITRYDHLDMDHGVGLVFSVFLLGGAALAFTDFAALRWLGLRETLRQSSPLKAAGRVLLLNLAVPWAAFAITWIFAIQSNKEYRITMIFSAWVITCLTLNAILIAACRRRLQSGIRQQIAAA